MNKKEAEPLIRHLVTVWAKETGFDSDTGKQPSFSAFKTWLSQKGQSGLLIFRSVAGADYDAEMWFDQELKQTWRN